MLPRVTIKISSGINFKKQLCVSYGHWIKMSKKEIASNVIILSSKNKCYSTWVFGSSIFVLLVKRKISLISFSLNNNELFQTGKKILS